MVCVHPLRLATGDKLASAKVYVTSPVGLAGAVVPRLYNRIVALFNPASPSPPPANIQVAPSHLYHLLLSSVSIQISPTFSPTPVGSSAC